MVSPDERARETTNSSYLGCGCPVISMAPHRAWSHEPISRPPYFLICVSSLLRVRNSPPLSSALAKFLSCYSNSAAVNLKWDNISAGRFL